MTTLIDRILSQIIPAFVDYNLRTKKHIIEYGDTPETFQLAEDRLNIEKQLEYNLRQILEAELTAVKGVDELIKKRKHNHIDCGQERGILIEDFIADLKTLQSERDDVEIRKKYIFTDENGEGFYNGDCKCNGRHPHFGDKYCGNCGVKIKRIE